jgi:hypothetical protein
MKHALLLAAAVLVLASVQGCATKTYGRQPLLTDKEKESMTCRDIDLDTAKVRAFIDRVKKESEFSGRDAIAVLGDFGMGNNLEKTDALQSANTRLVQLRHLRETKGCGPEPVQ